MKTHVTLLVLLFYLTSKAQYQTDSIISLKSPITESSGLLYLNGAFITHNDSGGEAALYEIDSLTGLPSRTVYISNATNIDWEDIAADDDYIYIGDFGNNQGTRQNLRIYKLSLVDYWMNDTVFADTINFSYADQSSFTPMPFQTNYDAEGLISKGDSLYVFTKQWGTPGSRAYSLPKSPGTYSSAVYDVIPITVGLVTGADYFEAGGVLALSVNKANLPELHTWNHSPNSKFSTGFQAFTELVVFGSIQVEGIVMLNNSNFFLTSEAFNGENGTLSWINSDPFFSMSEENIIQASLYPNPSSELLRIESEYEIEELFIISLEGKTLLIENQKNEIDISELPNGVYIIRIITAFGSKDLRFFKQG